MPGKAAHVEDEREYEAWRDKGIQSLGPTAEVQCFPAQPGTLSGWRCPRALKSAQVQTAERLASEVTGEAPNGGETSGPWRGRLVSYPPSVKQAPMINGRR